MKSKQLGFKSAESSMCMRMEVAEERSRWKLNHNIARYLQSVALKVWYQEKAVHVSLMVSTGC